ncbi:MAG: restriction endonuclease subunit S [Sporichthyaceae bacterium]
MRQISLRDACARIDYGLTTSAVANGVGPRFLRITDIESSNINWPQVPRCEATPMERERYRLLRGDVVVARTGASTGRSAWVQPPEDAVFASYLVRFRAGTEVDSRFLGYVLASGPWRDYIHGRAHGKSAQPNLSAGDMAEFEFMCPDLLAQRAIAEVLGALDDKIAANTRRVVTADALSAARFASIIEGADTAPLSSTAEFINGRAFTKDASGTGRVVIRIAELNSGIGGSTVYSDAQVTDQHVARPGDLLFAWSGSLTVHRWFRPEGIVNQHIFKVVPKAGHPRWLVKQLLMVALAEFKAIAADKATTMGHIQRHHLDLAVPLPSRESIGQRDAVMTNLYESALLTEQENLSLAAIRDALLPELMSGRLQVRDAASAIEGIV